MDVHCSDKISATDTIYSDTHAIDDGPTCAQWFFVTDSLVSDIYGMNIDKQFVNTLEYNIRDHGEISKFISDQDQSKVINIAHSILGELFIDDLEK